MKLIPGEKRYYIMHNLPRSNPAGKKLINEVELFGDGYPRILTPPAERKRGFRDYPAKPLFHISKRFGRKPPDIEFYLNYWFISDHAKRILSAFCHQNLVFLPLDIKIDLNMEPAEYWLCDVTTILDAIDESRSVVRRSFADDGSLVHNIIGHYSLAFDDVKIGRNEVFRLATNVSTIACTERFRQEIKSAGLKGVSFRQAFEPAFEATGVVVSVMLLGSSVTRTGLRSGVGRIKPDGGGKEINFHTNALTGTRIPKIGQTVRVTGRRSAKGPTAYEVYEI